MHGLGNDFVILDGRTERIAMTPALAAAIANRHRGVGCDQLIVLGPAEKATLSMSTWNADGGAAQTCGNATRCVVALTGAERIETAGGFIEGKRDGADIEVSLGEPRFGWDEIPLAYPADTAALPMAWDELQKPAAVNVGNPHLVFFVDEIEDRRLSDIGPVIEHDPAFPERINVNVAWIAGDHIELRTWERGAGLTLACGTGACATAIAAIRQKLTPSPVEVRMKGGSLAVSWAPGEPVRMRGPATHVFSGEIDLDALGASAAPHAAGQ